MWLSKRENATGLLLFARDRQSAVEEFGGGAVGAEPIAPAEQVVNFVGDNQLFERDVLGTQFFYQIGGLLERHVAIVVVLQKVAIEKSEVA